ncbi:MAG: PIG-L family deacetylase [Actinomycetota bacterium]|mgnify:FL=1|uniref:Mycothiol conjugate amidase Mca n=1 Tax=marine metagenome TaxID=408172 RepID=A0A381QKK3_9ZZZZ|nr:PIG-L family deacetylase [Acidimicrobiales bacterium]MEE3187915.1 PIG-L family deacetylase [Actinomycetota bacterium]|tara:strand:+ start:2231 stop:3094 length:864 start_codon:yes stop_codon:yes gene_type:complete
MSLSILTVHAHPDDESSKGPGTINMYSSQGIRTTLVCCTGGEVGDILNPAMDRTEVRENLASVRRAELDSAAAIIGYDEVVMLGYRDSGMPDSDHNQHPEAFANAELDTAVERLVKIIRRVRPQVIVTYPEVQSRYPHPDHLQVTAVSFPAYERAGDPDWYPEAGPPHEPSKLYAPVWSRQRLLRVHQAFLDRGLKSPYDKKWLSGRDRDDRITAVIKVDNAVRRKALLAHATQVDPESPFWFGLPDAVQDAIHPYEEYMLLLSRVATEEIEDDLFAGLRHLDGGSG